MSTHEAKIIPNANAHVSDFKLKVVCSCQFEALARNQSQAEYYRANHLGRHGALDGK
jgi:hypothetical protein